MTLTEQEKSIRKEFRKYLREVEGQKGYRLNALIKAAEEKAYNILKENQEKLNELSAFLLEKETITGEEFMKILNS